MTIFWLFRSIICGGAEASESKLVWAGQVARAVDTAVRDTLAVGGASTHDAKADAAVRNALKHCEGKARTWANKNPALASVKARAWYAIGVCLPPITAAVVAEVLPYRSVHQSNYRGVGHPTHWLFVHRYRCVLRGTVVERGGRAPFYPRWQSQL